MKKLLIAFIFIGVLRGTARAVYPIIPVAVQSGMIFMWAGSTTPPSGYFICNGSTVSQTGYSALYAAIGTVWNVGGEPAGTFRLPNMSGASPYGPSVGTPYSSLATIGGSTVTASVSVSGSATTSSSGAHQHVEGGVTYDSGNNFDAQVNHASYGGVFGSATLSSGGASAGSVTYNKAGGSTGSQGPSSLTSPLTSSAGAHTHTVSITSTGTATILPPFVVLEFIIKQ